MRVVSIHTLARGVSDGEAEYRAADEVSIHTLARGVSFFSSPLFSVRVRFQSTPSREG